MAKLSLQEQLLKSGLVSSGQAKAVRTEKQKQVKQQQHNKKIEVDVAKEQVQKLRLEQAEKDRELNLLRKQEEEQKHLAAQVKQIIEQNRLAQTDSTNKNQDDSVAYHFTDNNKVKTLYVSKSIRDQISQGEIAIVRLNHQYELVSVEIAEKIKLRDTACLIVFNQPAKSDENQQDPYSAYQVPDDLLW
jgi:uncharacterized protein